MDEITSSLNRLKTGLHNTRNKVIVDKMHKESIKHWRMFLEEFLDTTKALCEELAKDCVQAAFGQWQKTPLYQRVLDLTVEFHNKVLTREFTHLHAAYELEERTVLTMDDEQMERLEREIVSALTRSSHRQREREWLQTYDLSEEKLSKAEREMMDRATERHPDPWHRQITEMAVSPHQPLNALCGCHRADVSTPTDSARVLPHLCATLRGPRRTPHRSQTLRAHQSRAAEGACDGPGAPRG